MRYEILTIFPGFFSSFLEHGVLKRALATGKIEVRTHDLRAFTHDRHRTVDDRPFGGGEGMVLKPEPIADALASLGVEGRPQPTDEEAVILLSAQGAPLHQSSARELAKLDRVTLICGRYEGVDERINQIYCTHELSIGDYVLSGGELAAAVVVDATMRLVPGVLGNEASSAYESFGVHDGDPALIPSQPDAKLRPRATHGSGGLLDYPHYTRPVEFHGVSVPEVLRDGNHDEIRRWRREQALAKTLRNRPDLLKNAVLTPEDQANLLRLKKGQILFDD